MPDGIVQIPGKTTRKVASLFRALSCMNIELECSDPSGLKAIPHIIQAESLSDQYTLLLSTNEHEELCAYLCSTLENSSFSDQDRNTAAFILTCLKCNEDKYKLPHFSPPKTGVLQLLQQIISPEDHHEHYKKAASKLFYAFVKLPSPKEGARVNLTVSDALKSNIFWSLLTYLSHIDDMPDMPKNFMSLYHDDILPLIQTSLADDETHWPDNLQEILNIYFEHSSPENKTKAAYAIWQHINLISEQQRQAIKEQCLKVINFNFLTANEIPTAETLLAQVDDLLAHNIPLFMQGLQQTLDTYNIYDDTIKVDVFLARCSTLDKICEKIKLMEKSHDSLPPTIKQIENVRTNLNLYIALKEASVKNIGQYLAKLSSPKSTAPCTINEKVARAMLLFASKQYDEFRTAAWKLVKQHTELQSKFTPESLFNIAQQSRLSTADHVGAALEVLEHFHPFQNEKDQRPEQEKVQCLVEFVDSFSNSVSDKLYRALLEKAYTKLPAKQFVSAFEHYQKLKHVQSASGPFDDKQRHANFLILEMLTRCTDLLTFPLLQQMLETTQDPKTRIEALKKILSQPVEGSVMQTLAGSYLAEIKEECYDLAEQSRDRALITIILQNTRSAASIPLEELEELEEIALQEVFNIVKTIEHHETIYADSTMPTATLLYWIERLAPPAKNQLAQMIFTDTKRIQDLRSMTACLAVINAATVEDAALPRFFDYLARHGRISTQELIALAESFADRPQARSYLARAILQNTRRLDACEASLDTVIAMLTPENLTAIVDMLDEEQIDSHTMTPAKLALKFIQTGRLTSEQVQRLAPICLFTFDTTTAKRFLTQNRLDSNALAELLEAHLVQKTLADAKGIISSQLIPLGNDDARMHDALKQYLQAHLPVFAAVSLLLPPAYIKDMPIEIAKNITENITDRVADKQEWVERYLSHNTPSGEEIMQLLIAMSDHWATYLAAIFPRLLPDKQIVVAQRLFETPEFFDMPVVDEETFSQFIFQCINLPGDAEDPTRRLRALVNNPHISSLTAHILLKYYSTQLSDAEFNTLCNRLKILKIIQLVTTTVDALTNPEQADAAEILLKQLAQNEYIKQQLEARTDHTEQTAYFRLYYDHTKEQEIARDILQVTTSALLDRLCNDSPRDAIRLAAQLKLDTARQTLAEHAENINQLPTLMKNTRSTTVPTDRACQFLSIIINGLKQNPEKFVDQWKFKEAPKQVLTLAQFLLYPAVVKSKFLNQPAIVFIKQQEQAALDVLHKDKNWLSRAWEKFKYNVAQSWTRIVASKTSHTALEEVIKKTTQLTSATTTGQISTSLGITSGGAAVREEKHEEASLQEATPVTNRSSPAGAPLATLSLSP